MDTTSEHEPAALADALLTAAKRAGADAAEALVTRGESLSVAARDGALEEVERAEGVDYGLRVVLDASGGKRQAVVSASDARPETLAMLAERAVAMAREAPVDADVVLAERSQQSPDPAAAAAAMALVDGDTPPPPEALLEEAKELEALALAVTGVTRAEGAQSGWRRGAIALATSSGFVGGYDSSSHGRSVSAIAGEGLGMERDYAYTAARTRSGLRPVAEIGAEAGERAIKRLNPKKPTSGAYPVVFEPRVASGLVSSLLGALNGQSIVRGSSFLKDKMGERILPEGLDVIDDPLLAGGLGSRPFDGEGLAGARKRLIADGVVAEWLLDLSSARRLGLTSNGCARRGLSAPPSPGGSNAWLTPGAVSPAALIGEISQGLFVTEMMGRGLNPVTGDYSRAATGYWIENGQITYPVSELTVAGSIFEMLAHLAPADDLGQERSVEAPTVRIEGLTVASEA